jgi:hypothetical protein
MRITGFICLLIAALIGSPLTPALAASVVELRQAAAFPAVAVDTTVPGFGNIGVHAGYQGSVVRASVAEPATILLLGTALLALCGFMWRRKRK